MIHNYALIILLCLSMVGMVSADDMNLTIHLSGNVVYDDLTPVPAGTEIVIYTHDGREVGQITTTVDGKYGSPMMFDGEKLVVTATYGDQLYWYVNGTRSPDMFIVASSGDFVHDIMVAAPPVQTTIPEPTTDITPTVEITPIITEPPVHPIAQPTSLLHNDVEGVEIWVLGGVVGTFVIIIVAYLILTYITRDDNEGNTLK